MNIFIRDVDVCFVFVGRDTAPPGFPQSYLSSPTHTHSQDVTLIYVCWLVVQESYGVLKVASGPPDGEQADVRLGCVLLVDSRR